MEKTILLLLIMSLFLTACFPACAAEAQPEEVPETAPEEEMPASFDLRSVDTDGDGIGDRRYVTPVRFQNPFASCWVFAAISAAETSLLGSVYADDPEAWKTLNLSEKQLGYFSHMLLDNPSSPQHGEGLGALDPSNMFEVYGGGSTVMAAAAMAQGIGPSDEHSNARDVGEFFEYHGKERIANYDYIDGAYRKFSYSDEDDWTIPGELRFHQDYFLMDAHFLPSPASMPAPESYAYNEAGTAAIKRQLLKKHGVMISLLADSSVPQSISGKNVKYISENWAHYTWDYGSSNHSVAIIGWDDHYPKENFLAGHQPPADGAWLAKNSWGSAEEAFPACGRGNWGIENEKGQHTGFFWISYYDHSISEPVSLELKAAAAPQSIDQHDYFPLHSPNSKTYDKPVSMANIFKADHSKTLRAISCMTAAPGTSVHYQVYLLQDGYQTPEDGLMVAEGSVSFEYAGFHRIPVSEIRLQKDQYFSVLVTLVNQEGTYDVLMPQTFGFAGNDRQTAIVNERESYLHQDGQWQDYGTVVEAILSESEALGETQLFNLSYDNFPIKTYSSRAAADIKLKLTHSDNPLSMLEGYNTDLYSLQFIAGSDFEIRNPSILWQPLPGSDDIVEMETMEQGSKLSLTAKAPGTALFSVTAEGFGTTVFPVTVSEARLEMALIAASDLSYTGQEIKPMVLVYSSAGPILKEGVHYQLTYHDNIRCGLARAEAVGIGTCAEPDRSEPVVDYFPIVPVPPEILSLTAQSGEIRLTVTDQSDIGSDGCSVRYRLKGSDEWASSSFGAGQTDLTVSGLNAGEYEIQVCGFVDSTEAPVPEMYRKIFCGDYGDVRTVVVP